MMLGLINRQKKILFIGCCVVYLALFGQEHSFFHDHTDRSLQDELILATMKRLEEDNLGLLPNFVPSDNLTESSFHHRKETLWNDNSMSSSLLLMNDYDDELPPIRAIVTGLEHSGSNIIAKTLFNAPCMIGAPETAFLIADTPADIEEKETKQWMDQHQNMKQLDDYTLSHDDIEVMKQAKDFLEMYNILRERSPLFEEIREDDCSIPQVIDHTPQYVYPSHLEGVLSKTPGVPVIITQMSFETLSEFWAGEGRTLTQNEYDEVFDNIENLQKKYPHRIKIIDCNTELTFDTAFVMVEVFRSLSLRWDAGFLDMSGLRKKVSGKPKYEEAFKVLIDHFHLLPGRKSTSNNITDKTVE
jgi:hypothetical protein